MFYYYSFLDNLGKKDMPILKLTLLLYKSVVEVAIIDANTYYTTSKVKNFRFMLFL